MALKTARFDTAADVVIDAALCTGCGRCVSVCHGAPLQMTDGQVTVDQDRYFGCIGCGHCMMVCPNNAVIVRGRDMSPEMLFDLPDEASRTKYGELLNLMRSRRSVRTFDDRGVPRNVIDAVVEAVATAPMGIPPSDVEILILDNREKVAEFAGDMVDLMVKSRWVFSLPMRIFMRAFYAKEEIESLKTFVLPLIDVLREKREQGVDWLLYNAPLAMYFYTSAGADPADPLVAATYAVLAAESQGLSNCMIGSVAPFLQTGGGKVKEKYGIPKRSRQGIMVIFGYSRMSYRRGVTRSLGGVRFY
ncbi:MAG: nitroreductase family protein [Deltaproteobacteria bacterium]|nr:nitroreductase family protein [Candidatus Zymogenaceae bacterium]